MKRLPADQRFYLQDSTHLAGEVRRLALDLPLDDGPDVLQQPLMLAGRMVPNRFLVRPATANDAQPGGAPSALTMRRYDRFIKGGCGILCTEPVSIAPDARRHAHQLCLNTTNVPAFSALTAALHDATAIGSATPAVRFIQLDDVPEDGENAPDAIAAVYAAAAQCAAAAGFDGVEILADGVMSRHAEFKQASRLLYEIVASVREVCPELAVAVRLCVYSARGIPCGFGADAADYRTPDLTLPVELARRLAELGVSLLNMTYTHPALRDGPAADPVPEDGFPHEHPLSAIARGMRIAGTLRAAVPSLAISAGGFDWLRQCLPPLAAGLVRHGVLDLVALDRFALAYPDAPARMLAHMPLAPNRCCLQCGACDWLRQAGGRVGCVLQDDTIYGAEYRFHQRYAHERLVAEANRCHQCVPAPCVHATPGALDIPGFMRAFARGDVQRAGGLLRRGQLLPEMCAQLAPFGDSGERACVETVFCGRPVAIRDLQYSAAVQTRDRVTGAECLPDKATGYHVAIAGAGPAGLAAAAVLLRHGHHVTLYERAAVAGGVPALLIPASRYGGNADEVAALLAPARRAGRLTEHYGTGVGPDMPVRQLRDTADALLLTVGLWQDRRVTSATAPGVQGGLAFLQQAKAGGVTAAPGRAAVLAGGDCAMDVAMVLKDMGADPLYVIFGGGRADMHWCMEESWFAQRGVHLLTLCRPVGYCQDRDGHLSGLRTVRLAPDAAGVPREIPSGEYVIDVDTVVDASGLETENAFRSELPGQAFSAAGILQCVDAGSFRTVMDGVFAAGALINGGASVPQCVDEGMRAAEEITQWLETR